MTATKVKLSSSTNFRGIKIAATATAGTAIHTATSTANTVDEIWLWITNSSTSAVKVTIEFGGATSPDDTIEQTIPAESGPVPVIPGLCLDGGVAVAAFAGTTNVLLAHGYVNRLVNI